MMIPTIHVNGTAGKDLLREYEEAIRALYVAHEKVAALTVHGRDYYVQDQLDARSEIRQYNDTAYARARAEHDEHLSTLTRISHELLEVYEGIDKQVEEKKKART